MEKKGGGGRRGEKTVCNWHQPQAAASSEFITDIPQPHPPRISIPGSRLADQALADVQPNALQQRHPVASEAEVWRLPALVVGRSRGTERGFFPTVDS